MEKQIEERYEIINIVKKELNDLKTNDKTIDSSMDVYKQECDGFVKDPDYFREERDLIKHELEGLKKVYQKTKIEKDMYKHAFLKANQMKNAYKPKESDTVFGTVDTTGNALINAMGNLIDKTNQFDVNSKMNGNILRNVTKQEKDIGLSQVKKDILGRIPDCFGCYCNKCKISDCKYQKSCIHARDCDFDNLNIRFIFKLYYLKFAEYPKSKYEAIIKLKKLKSDITLCSDCYYKDKNCKCDCVREKRPLCFKSYGKDGDSFRKVFCDICKFEPECKNETEKEK